VAGGLNHHFWFTTPVSSSNTPLREEGSHP
jgi:hypothetical protein